MSEHRRKRPNPSDGGRAAARRGAPPPGRRAAPRGAAGPAAGPYGDDAAYGEEAPYAGRAAARRARKRGGGRRRAGAAGAGAAAGAAAAGSAAGAGHGGHGGHGGGGGGYGGGSGDYGPGDGDPGGNRWIDYPRSGRYGASRWVPSWKQVGGVTLGSMALLVAGAGIGLAVVSVPNPQEAAQAQKNVYYWDNKKPMVVAGGGDVNRQIVPLSKIPKHMQDAVISAENASFYEDAGVDPMGILRAVFRMATGGTTQSGSTITQQYVKNAMLSQEQTISRKVKELLISTKVGATKSKGEILAGYLNTAYYGRGAYGIQAASRAYFDKPCDKLNASESAFLSSLLNGPNLYDPAGGVGASATKEKNRKRAEARWSWTLDREVATGRLPKADRAKITKFPHVKEPRKATEKKGQIGYLTDLADGYATSKGGLTKEELDRGGYHIYTTFNKKKVQQMQDSVKTIYKRNIRPKERDEDKFVQFGGASVKPKDGAIVAIYGGTDWTKHFTNNADVTGAQVGSTFKPFVLAAALRDGVRNPKLGPDQNETERKQVSPSSVYSGKNNLKIRNYDGSVWQNEEGKQWRQVNDGKQSYGDITLREAMRVSANSPYVQLGMDVGTETVQNAAVDAGLLKDSLKGNTSVPSFALGISSPSAIRMATAYGTFAASGVKSDPYSVKLIKDSSGNEVYQHKEKTSQSFTSAVADNVTDVLKNVVEKGTGTAARLPGRDVAGKTGTTDGNKSAWFVGYTPQLSTAIGMWRLNDDAAAKNRQFLEMFGTGGQKKIHGASFPSEIWATYMRQALANTSPLPFPKPVPIGEKVYGPGASPSPTPTPTPSPTETQTEEPTAPPSPSNTCGLFDPNCEEETGGQDSGGGWTEGNDGGQTTTPEPPSGGNGNGGNGSDSGGLFGGTRQEE